MSVGQRDRVLLDDSARELPAPGDDQAGGAGRGGPWGGATRQPMAPTVSDARGPARSATQPTMGPPIGVLPRNTIAWMASTRPRYAGAASTWTIAVDEAMNVMLLSPTSPAAGAMNRRLGAAAMASRATPKPAA